MNKAISFAAILALSAASQDFADNDLNILKTIGHDLKKAGEFVVQHPKIITTAAKFLDDEAVAVHRLPQHIMAFSDEELNILTTIKNDAKKAGHFIAEHPELITKAAEAYKILHKDDDIENELNIFKTIGHDLKKAGEFVVQHPKIITTAAKFLDDEAVAVHRLPQHIMAFSDEELNILTTIKNDAKKVGHFVAEHPQIITTAAKFLDDDELNILKTIGHDLKKAGEFVVQHPKIITTAAKFLDDESAENELNVWTTIKNDAKKVGNFVADHPQIITEGAKVIKTLKHDDAADDELNVWTTIKNDAKKVGHFVADHPQLITEGAKVYKTLKHDDAADDELNILKTIGHDLKKAGEFVVQHPKIITTAAKFLDDESAENELNVWTTIKNDAKKVGNFVADHPQIITEGAKVIKTLKHDDVADDELGVLGKIISTASKFLDDDDEFFAHERVEQRVHEGVKKAQKDVRTATEALKKFHNEKRTGIHHDSLSNLGELLHEGHKIHRAHKNSTKAVEAHDNHLSVKGVANWIGDHPQVITEAAKTYKILKH